MLCYANLSVNTIPIANSDTLCKDTISDMVKKMENFEQLTFAMVYENFQNVTLGNYVILPIKKKDIDSWIVGIDS